MIATMNTHTLMTLPRNSEEKDRNTSILSSNNSRLLSRENGSREEFKDLMASEEVALEVSSAAMPLILGQVNFQKEYA